jgi:autotransporter-associated beta strand protein
LVVAGNANLQTLTNLKDFVGTITGAGTLTVIGSQGLRMETDMSGFTGTLVKNNTNELHLMIDNATFGTNATTSGSAAARFELNVGKTFLLNNSQAGTAYMGSLAGTGGTIFSKFNRSGDVTLEVGALGLNTSYAGVINDGDGTAPVGSNITSFRKVGSGIQTLTAANLYSGGTIVDGGTLLINNTAGSGTGSGLVTVNAGGTLGGNGTITTTGLTVNAGGILAPGNSPDQFTINGPVTLGPGSIFGVELAVGGVAATGDGTVGTDLLTVNGTIDVTGALLSGTWGGSAPANVFTGTLTADNMLWVIENDLLDSITGTFANTTLSPGLDALFGTAPNTAYITSIGGRTFAAFYGSQFGVIGTGGLTGGNDLLLVAIPEPGRALLALLALAGFVVRRRRR